MPYRWEPTAGVSGRYRDTSTGRYVQGATVRRELDQLSGQQPTRLRRWPRRCAAGSCRWLTGKWQ
jgi:hypothetical protein